MKHACLAAAALLSLSPSAKAAAPAPDVAGREAAIGLSEVVVTAARSPQPADQVGQSVSVLTQADIRTNQTLVLTDLLAFVPGVGVSRNGGVGGLTYLRIRGAEAGQTVVVVDGVKLNDPTAPDSAFDFANLLAGDVARIEVLRGAQSTLWGSQAIGGVVNIVTAEPTKPLQAEASLEGGSRGTLYAHASAGGAGDHVIWRLGAQRYVTDGISAYRFGTEPDGYRNTGVSGRARVILNPAASFDLRAVWAQARNNFDGFPPPNYQFADTSEYGATQDVTAYAGLNLDLFEGRLRNRFGYGLGRTDRETFDPTQAVTRTTFQAFGRTHRFEYQGEWQVAPGWIATFGAEREQTSMRTAAPNPFDPKPAFFRAQAKVDSLYAQGHGALAPGLTLTLGGRRDDHDAFGSHIVGQASAAWSLNGGATILRAGYGEGFKAPSLYQLYSEFGNGALKPETADDWHAGAEQHFAAGAIRLSATWFQRETQNQIDFVSCFSVAHALCADGRFGFYDNVARARAHGIELGAEARLSGLDFAANYTWTRAENAAAGDANYGRTLARRPEHQANLSLNKTWTDGFSTGATARYVGEAFDNPTHSRVLKSYGLLDLHAAYRISPTWEIYARAENALDAAYETTANYGAPGRSLFVGIRAHY